MLESVQIRATKLVDGLHDLEYTETLRSLTYLHLLSGDYAVM